MQVSLLSVSSGTISWESTDWLSWLSLIAFMSMILYSARESHWSILAHLVTVPIGRRIVEREYMIYRSCMLLGGDKHVDHIPLSWFHMFLASPERDSMIYRMCMLLGEDQLVDHSFHYHDPSWSLLVLRGIRWFNMLCMLLEGD